MSETENATSPKYSFAFDKAKDAWVCSVHGEVDFVGWVRCWNGRFSAKYRIRPRVAP